MIGKGADDIPSNVGLRVTRRSRKQSTQHNAHRVRPGAKLTHVDRERTCSVADWGCLCSTSADGAAALSVAAAGRGGGAWPVARAF